MVGELRAIDGASVHEGSGFEMSEERDELQRRMARPQRHRLLQGYPMVPLMRPASPDRGVYRTTDGALKGYDRKEKEPPFLRIDPKRPLIIGVLPHTQCNPRVEGCGFCTFPHDAYAKRSLVHFVDAVADGIAHLFAEQPSFAKRRVDGLYFGGATANLTPRKSLQSVVDALAKRVDLTHAEVTLEGIPSLFRSLLPGPFEVLRDMPARHRRLSMGVQTFDAKMLERMGRQSFGDRRTVAQVVQKAHGAGMTISGDFLINLPGEPCAQMMADLRDAVAMGFDQICVYHLVLTEDMDVPWAKDAATLQALPRLPEACDNWLAARAFLLENGYVQTTLTNFERADVRRSDKRFVYEDHSFTPEQYDALGFGKLAISTFVDIEARRAVKFIRDKRSRDDGSMWGRHDFYFAYEEEDFRLLWLTRTLARLAVPRATYKSLFGADLLEHFRDVVAAVEEAGLCVLSPEALEFTPRGMFFADSVAGLFSWRRVQALRPMAAGQHTRDLLNRRAVVDFMG